MRHHYQSITKSSVQKFSTRFINLTTAALFFATTFAGAAPLLFASTARAAGTVADHVVINEVSSHSSSDWVELYNPTAGSVNLTGWYIADNDGHDAKSFSNSSIAAHGFVIVDMNNLLNKDVDTATLFDNNSQMIDQVSYGGSSSLSAPTNDAKTLSRVPDGGSNWVIQQKTKETTNDPSAQSIPACDTATSGNFEGDTDGSVNGQSGWKSTGNFDQSVVGNTYGYSNFGCKALRISNAETSGSFGDQTYSYSTTPAGESASNDHFVASFDIASTKSSEQPGMHLSVSPDNGSGSRMSYVGFTDTANGIDVTAYDVEQNKPCTPSGCANFVSQDLGTISYDTAHNIKIDMQFNPGPSNDVVKIYIDGTLKYTGDSWEDYYRYDPEQAGNGNQVPVTDSLLFLSGGTAVAANQGNGYLFDNVDITTDHSVPAAPTAPTNLRFTQEHNGSIVEYKNDRYYLNQTYPTPGKTIGFSWNAPKGLTNDDVYVVTGSINGTPDSRLNQTVGWTKAGTLPNYVGNSKVGMFGDGVYKLTVVTKNTYTGLTSSPVTLSITYDATLPATTLNVANINHGYVSSQLHGDKLTITGHASDKIGLNRVLVQLLNSKHGAIENHTVYLSSTSDDWSTDFDINKLGLSDGPYSVVASVDDNAGNVYKTSYLDFTLDNTLPEGTVTYTGGIRASDIIYLKSIDDLKYSASLSDNYVLDQTSFVVFKLDQNGKRTGEFCGNWHNSSSTEFLSGSNATVNNINVNKCNWYKGLGAWTDGTYEIVHRVYDKAGNSDYLNTSTPIQKFIIDSIAPDVTFGTATGSVQKDLKINASISDEHLLQYGFDVSGPDGIHFSTANYKTNQQTIGLTDFDLCAAAYYGTCPANLPDGTYNIRAKAYDNATNGNTSKTITIVIDRSAPDGTFDVPTGFVNKTVNISVDLTAVGAAGLGEQEVVLRDSNGIAVGNWQYNVKTRATRVVTGNGTFNYTGDDRSGTLTISFDTTGLNGTYNLRLFTHDQLNNSRSNIYGQLKLDNTAPTVHLDGIASLVNGTINITGWVNDNINLDHYNLSLYQATTDLSDGGTHTGDRITSFTSTGDWGTKHVSGMHADLASTLDTASLPDGTYQLRLAAKDAATNEDMSGINGDPSSVQVISFTVDNSGPQIDTSKGYTTNQNVFTPQYVDNGAGDTYSWAGDPSNLAGANISDSTLLNPDFTVTKTGDYKFTLTSKDSLGNTTTALLAFTYTAPAGGQGSGGSTEPSATSRGAASGFTNVSTTVTTPANNGANGVLGARTTTPSNQSNKAVKGDKTSKQTKELATTTGNDKNGFNYNWLWLLLLLLIPAYYYARNQVDKEK